MFDAARTRVEVSRAVDLLGLPVGATILDVPCGQGRHAKLLADAGFDVTGFDLSAHLLQVARRGRRRAGLKFVRGDMRALPARWTARFDGVVSLGTSFGFFADPADDAAVLAGYARVLRPGGTLVLHAPDRDGVVSSFVSRDWWHAADGTLVLHEREFDPLSGVVTVRRTIRRGASSEERSYRLRVYTVSELASLAQRAGLIVTEALDGLRPRPVRRRSRTVMLVAVRSE